MKSLFDLWSKRGSFGGEGKNQMIILNRTTILSHRNLFHAVWFNTARCISQHSTP